MTSLLRRTTLLAAAAALVAAPASAATLYWDGATVTGNGVSAGGAGSWSSGGAGWDNGAAAATWNNAANDTAVFGGTAGTVSLGSGITAGGLTFDTAGYTITGNTLTLAGTTPTITTNQNVTISSIVAGTAGFTKAGNGTLTLSGNNTYTGPVTINAGTLAVGVATLSNWNNNGTTYVSAGSNSTLALNSSLNVADLTAANFASVIIKGAWITTATNAAVQSSTFTNDGTTVTFWAAFWDGNSYTKAVKLQVTKSGSDFLVQQVDARYVQANIIGSATFATQIASGGQPPSGSGGYGVTNIAMVDAGSLGVADMTLNGGSLSLSDTTQVIGALSGVAGSTVTGTGFLTVGSGNGNGAYAGVISGSLALTKVGTGTQVLSGANTYTASTTISAGTVRIGNAAGLGSTGGGAGTAVASGATLDLNGQAVGAEEISVVGTGVGGAGALVSSTGNATLAGNVILTGAASVGGAGNLAVSGVVSGAFALTKVGNGTLTLSGSNSYSGGTVLSQGGIVMGNGNAIGSGGITIGDASTGTSNLSLLIGGNFTFNRALTITNSGSGTVTLGATGAFANPEFSGAITLQRDVILTGGSNTDRMTFTGGIGGTGNVTITGPNRVMFLNATNTFAGNLTVASGGILQLHWGGATSVVNYIPDASIVTVNGILKIAKGNNSSETIGGLAGSGEIRSHEGVANVTSGLVIDNAADHTFSGVLSNGGATGAVLALTKNGAGNQTLSGSSTHTGGTTVNAGTLTLGNATNTLADTGAVNVAGGTLALGVNSDTIGALTLTSGSITGSGNGTLSAASVSLLSGTVSAKLGGSGAVTKSGAGSVTLSGANTHTGGTTVSDGTLTVTNASGLGSGALTVSGGTLSLGANVSGVGAATLTGGEITGSGSLAASLDLQSGTVSAVLAGTGTVTKSGAGTATLSGINTYTGATTIANGTLSLSGSLAADSSVAVNGGTLAVGATGSVAGSVEVGSGATLSLASGGSASGAIGLASGSFLRGEGTAGAVTVYDGTARLVAGTGSSGTLSLGSLDFQGAGTLAIGGLSNYLLQPAFAVAGSLTTSGAPGAVTLSLPVGLVSNGTYVLISFGSTTATAADFSVTGPLIGARQSGILSLDTVAGLLQYDVAGDSPAWTGANGSAFLGGSNWSLINGGTVTDFISGDAMLLDDSAVATTVDISGADVDPAVLTFANETAAYTLQGTHGLASGGIVKTGAGSLTIANANSLSTLDVVGGTVVLGASGALGTAAATLSGGSLDLNGQSTAASVLLDGGSLIGSGTVSGVVSGSLGLSKSTAGTLTLSASNTFTGGTTVSAGILALGNATDTLLDTGAVTVSGGELSLGANDDTVGAVTVSGGSITGSGTLTGSSYALTGGAVSAKLGGSAALTKSGAGTATLSGANTYTGGTTVSNGTLAVGDDAALGTGAVTLSGGALALSGQTLANAVTLSGGSISGSGTVSGALTGASALTKAGSGTLTVSNADGFSGAINVTGGTLAVSGSLGAGAHTGAISLAASASLAVDNASAQSLTGVISGAGSLVKTGNGVLTIARNNTFSGGLTVLAGTVNLNTSAGYDGLNASAGRGDLTIAAGATVNANIYFSYGGYASTGNTKVVNVAGTLNMTGSEYARTYNLTAGTINAPTTNNDFLRSSTDGLTINSLAAGSSSVITGNIDFTFNSGVINTEDGAAANDLVISGNISQNRGAGSGSKTLVKGGAGRLVLSGNNTFNGVTTINAGTLAIASGGGIYRGGYAGSALSIASGATLEVENWGYNETTASLGGLTANASGLYVNGGTIRVVGTTPTSYGRGVTVAAGGATLEAGAGANWTIDVFNDSVAWSFVGDPDLTLGGAGTGAIQKQLNLGTGTLSKVGDGTWTILASNAYSGGTIVSGGTLVIGNAGSLGTGAVTLSGGTLDLGGLAVANAINFAGGSLINAASATSSVTVTGSVTTQELNALPGTEVSLGDGADVDLTGVTKTVVITGAPTVANLASFTGTLAVAGTLDLSAAGDRPSGATLELRAGGTLDFGSDTAFAGTVAYKGGSIQGAFTGTANVASTGVALVDGAITGGTIVVGAGASVDVTSYTGSVRLTGGSVSQGLGGFAGTLELASGGTLNLTTYAAPLATITVASGGVLSGTGSGGDVTLATGGILAPGNSPGLQTLGSLALQGGGSYDLEIQSTYAGLIAPVAGTDYDSVNVTGELDLSGLSSANRLILNLISLLADGSAPGDLADFDPSVPLTFDVFTYGSITGYSGSIEDYFTIDTTQLTFNGGSLSSANFSLLDTGTSIQLQYSPIPEPSTYGLILGGLAIAGAAIRRRKKNSK